jgi:hypothetical protein
LYDTHSGKKEDGRLVDHSMSQNFYKWYSKVADDLTWHRIVER